jgi:hypothetical protein
MVAKDGLYYPYINVRSINWLKATLLCFPHVLRMLPQEYIRRDSPEMREFSETEGVSGRPLLEAVNVLDPAYVGAQQSFLRRLKRDFERALPRSPSNRNCSSICLYDEVRFGPVNRCRHSGFVQTKRRAL